MRRRFRRVAASLCLLTAAGSVHADDRATCLLLAEAQWTDRGNLSLEACQKELKRQLKGVSSSEELRFAAWRDLLLAASTTGMYRSSDDGVSWQSAGVQAHSAPVPDTVSAAANRLAGNAAAPAADPAIGHPPAAAPPPAAAAEPAPAPAVPAAPTPAPAVAINTELGTQTAALRQAQADEAARRDQAKQEAARRTTPVTATVAAAPAPAPSAPPRQAATVRQPSSPAVIVQQVPTCQLRIGTHWESRPSPSLELCASSLELNTFSAPDGRGSAYWRGVYLASDSAAIYRSSDAKRWIKLRDRASQR